MPADLSKAQPGDVNGIGWQRVTQERPGDTEQGILLANASRVLGVLTGRTQRNGENWWWINDALFYGDADPVWFLELPEFPSEAGEEVKRDV